MPRINLIRHQVNDALEKYRAAGASSETLTALDWAWGYMCSELEGDHRRLASELDVTPETVYKAFAGYYSAIETFAERVKRARRRVGERISTMVETCVTRRIFEAMDYARDHRALVTIEAETGRGKTWIGREWCRRNNHGSSSFVHVPSACSRSKLVLHLAVALGVGVSNRRAGQLERKLFASIPKDKVLVFDEVARCIPFGDRTDIHMIELIRDFVDLCGCGVVLLLTHNATEALGQGRMADFLEQFRGRIRYRLVIKPGTFFRDELVALWRASAGSEPDEDTLALLAEIVRGDGKLRTLCDDLAKARTTAADLGRPMDAQILAAARQWREAGGVWPEETI